MRGRTRGSIEWRTPSPALSSIEYCDTSCMRACIASGQRQTDPRAAKKSRTPRYGSCCRDSRQVPRGLIPHNHCPGYISEEQYRRSQEQIRHNRFWQSVEEHGVRNGASLLAGILHYCQMQSTNDGRVFLGHDARITAPRGGSIFRKPPCQSLLGKTLDELVADRLLKALEPASCV